MKKHTRAFIALLGISVALVSCNTTSTPVDNNGSNDIIEPLNISLSQTEVKPLHLYTITVNNPKAGATYSFSNENFDYGGGKSDYFGVAKSEVSATLSAPLNVMVQNSNPRNTMDIQVVEKLNGKTRVAHKSINITSVSSPLTPGQATIQLFKAQRTALLTTSNRLAAFNQATGRIYYSQSTLNSLSKFASQLGKLQATIEQVPLKGSYSINIGNGKTLPLDISSLKLMDQYAMATVQLLAENASAQNLKASSISAVDLLNDPGSLARAVAEGIRENATRITSPLGAAVAVTGLVIGGSAVLPAAVLGALIFAVPTYSSTVISGILDLAADEASKGKASLESLYPTGKFLFSQTADYVTGSLKNKALTSLFGGTMGEIADTTLNTYQFIDDAFKNKVLSDYQSSSLAQGGYPYSPKAITLPNELPLNPSGCVEEANKDIGGCKGQ